VRAAETAVAAGERTEALNLTADALVALALGCRQVGDAERAAGASSRAFDLYVRKGNLVAARDGDRERFTAGLEGVRRVESRARRRSA
jgi:hypothetical protein